jgi:hypothetical protein
MKALGRYKAHFRFVQKQKKRKKTKNTEIKAAATGFSNPRDYFGLSLLLNYGTCNNGQLYAPINADARISICTLFSIKKSEQYKHEGVSNGSIITTEQTAMVQKN